MRLDVDVAIVGAGTAGMFATSEVRRAGLSYVLIDHGPLGTTCARVGCMPSKLALHAASLWRTRREMADWGMTGQEHLRIDLGQTWQRLRQGRDHFAGAAAGTARKLGADQLINGRARFTAAGKLTVSTAEGEVVVTAAQVILAVGSTPFLPDNLQAVADRCLTTNTLFEQESLPARIGVIGSGALGLEMGLALSRLGVQVHLAGSSSFAGIDDPVLSERVQASVAGELTLWLGQPATAEPAADGVRLRAGEKETTVDALLVAAGRRPNLAGLDLAAAGIATTARGLPDIDPLTLKIAGHPVYVIGDANASRTLFHEATDEGRRAGRHAAATVLAARAAAADTPGHVNAGAASPAPRQVPLSITFSDPDIVHVGLRHGELDPATALIGTASGEANGRLRILDSMQAMIRLYADRDSGRLLGAALFAPAGEHLGHLLALAITRGETIDSLLELPWYHPTIEELLTVALEDLRRQRKRAPG